MNNLGVMRALIVEPELSAQHSTSQFDHLASVAHATISSKKIKFRITEAQPIDFDPEKIENLNQVFVQVKAFSLNYRDRSWIFESAQNEGSRPSLNAIGSEFCAVVLAVGRHVENFQVGDRVMADMSWPFSGVEGILAGVPTNSASIEYQIFPANKLTKVPDKMSNSQAAGFSLCAQTAFSMVRRIDVQAEDTVLLTGATSNVSLYCAQILQANGAIVHGLSRSQFNNQQLKNMGFTKLFSSSNREVGDNLFQKQVRTIGGYRAIIDPFSDIYLDTLIQTIGFFGKYITCGVLDQAGDDLLDQDFNLLKVLNQMIIKNVTLIGNCLGLQRDLEGAIKLFEAGDLIPVIDSVHSSLEDFVERQFATDRLGKVIYSYEETGNG